MKKVALTSLLAAVIGTSPVQAADSTAAAPTTVATAQVQKEAVDVPQVAIRGTNTIHDAQFVRLAPFHDQPENAKKSTDDTAALLAADDANWAEFVKTDATTKMIADRYMVVNATVTLSEDYMATPKEESAIKSASEKLAKDDQKGAIDTLHLADISVIESQYLMPLNQTREAVAQAQKLLKAGKYHEANLVLKSAKEGIVMDSEMLVANN